MFKLTNKESSTKTTTTSNSKQSNIMRHKQRPIKSSRHKSVTFIIDSHTTSFGHNSNHNESLPSSSHQHHQRQQQQQQQQLLMAQQSNNNNRHHQQQQHNQHQHHQRHQIQSNELHQQQQSNHIGTNYPRKQFEHNITHMSDVMRLAFLENNDISISDCSNYDFNSLSTASILQRNIQQQLQQERRDQQLRQQLQFHQQQLNLNNHNNNNNRSDYLIQDADDVVGANHHDVDDDDDEEDGIEGNLVYDEDSYNVNEHHNQQHYDEEDYDMLDSRIFATSNNSTTPSYRSSSIGSTLPKSLQQIQHHQRQSQHTNRQRQQQSSSNELQVRLQVSGGSGRGGAKKTRTREPAPQVDYSDLDDSMKNFGEGFFCKEPGCGKSFPSLRKLRHHNVVHSDEFPFVCEFRGCAKKFKRKFGIDLHSTTHFDLDPDMYSKTSNNSSLPFFGRRMQYSMCKPCGQKFKTVHDYQYHMLKHGKEPFKCPVKGCGQTFGIWKSFQKHRASHYFNYYCKMDPSCKHHTSNLQLLKLHIYCCHFKRKLPNNATLASKDTHQSVKDEQVEVVDDDEQFEDEDQIQLGEDLSAEIDIKQETPSPQITPPKPQAKSTPQVPLTPRRDSRLRKNPPRTSIVQQQDEEDYNMLDSKIFATTPSNSSHRSSSVGSNIPKSLQQLQQHQRQAQQNLRLRQPQQHTQQQQQQQQQQPSGSNTNRTQVSNSRSGAKKTRTREPAPQVDYSDLDDSMKNFGEGFFCKEPGCGKSFPSLRKLRHHNVVHSDEFPFVCEFRGCAKKFKRKFGIDLHSTTHFDLDPDMYSKTSNNSSLPFFGRRMQYSMCKPCGQKFKTVHDYQYHMLKHGKEPFKCPVKGCGQTFGIWKSFQKHRASHYFNYYCKMDPSCKHHTSNLQLLKLHIYCCHFKRKLPNNATLASKDTHQSVKDEQVEVVDDDEQFEDDEVLQVDDEQVEEDQLVDDIEDQEEEDLSADIDIEQESSSAQQASEHEASPSPPPPRTSKTQTKTAPQTPLTPRRDSRLRKNPPRSCTFGENVFFLAG